LVETVAYGEGVSVHRCLLKRDHPEPHQSAVSYAQMPGTYIRVTTRWEVTKALFDSDPDKGPHYPVPEAKGHD
jgi:hypothetical protein